MSGHYLPADAFALLDKIQRTHRAPALLGLVLVWCALTAFLRLRLHRWGADVVLLALAISLVLVFVAACGYLLSTHSSYHFLGS